LGGAYFATFAFCVGEGNPRKRGRTWEKEKGTGHKRKPLWNQDLKGTCHGG